MKKCKQNESVPNIVGFLILGFSNNFGYAMMLSAANDLLKNKAPAGVVLLCDILPSFIIVLVYPLFQHRLSIFISTHIAFIFALIGFIFAGFSSKSVAVGLIGVIAISLQQGLGEASFLAYSALFSQTCLASWSLGTGLAGLVSTFLYMLMQSIMGVPHELIVWCFSVTPFLLLAAFYLIRPTRSINNVEEQNTYITRLSAKEKFSLVKPHLLDYFSLFFVFLFEYSVFQGVDTVLDYDNPSVKGKFYTTSCFAGQIGVFLSRGSLFLFQLKQWIIPCLFIIQAVNLTLFILESQFYFINNFYAMLVYVGVVGLFGGLCYVNVVNLLQNDKLKSATKFLLSIASLFMNFGVLLASGSASLLQILLK